MKKWRPRRRGSQRPAFTPLSAGTRDLQLRRYRVVPFGIHFRPLWVEPFGICRMHSSPGLVGDQAFRPARGPPGPSGEGRAPGRVPIAQLDYRTRPTTRLSARGRPAQPADPNADSPRPATQGDGPFADLRTLVAVDYAVRVPSGRQPIIDLSRYSSILMGGGIGVGRLARQVRGK